MDPLTWAIIFLILGILLVGIEFFVPSGGIIAITATVCIVTSIVMAYYNQGFATGTLFLIIATISVPIMLALGLKILPHTPFGRELIGRAPTSEEVQSDIATYRNQRALVGRIGIATTPILPSGLIEIEGQTIDAVSQGVAIEQGTPVKIVDVQGTRIVVRPLDPSELVTTAKAIQSGATDAELLARPLESFGLEELDEPLK